MRKQHVFFLALVVLFTANPWLCRSIIAGEIVGWGRDVSGRIANIPQGDDFVAVDAGTFHGVAIREDRSLAAWGAGQSGKPVENNFVDIAAGGYHSYALRSNGSLVAWGSNNNGQLNVPSGFDFVDVVSGSYHGLALRDDGSLAAWGNNVYGQGTPLAGNDFVAIAASGAHNFALWDSDNDGWGSIRAWGDDSEGEDIAPTGDHFMAIAAGAHYGVAIRDPDHNGQGELVPWGSTQFGLQSVPGGSDFVAVSAQHRHCYARRADGTWESWGSSAYDARETPAGYNFAAIEPGHEFTLGLTSGPSAPPVVPVVRDPDPVQLVLPSSGQLDVFTNGGLVDPSKPTIVLTHGWLRLDPNLQPDEYFGQLDEDLASIHDVNVMAWDWSGTAGAGTGFDLGLARSRTRKEGSSLGEALFDTLTFAPGQPYDQPIHFIGHSLGTMVNAEAADTIHSLGFNPQKTHVTLFDHAERANLVAAMTPDGLLKYIPLPIPDQVLTGWTKVIPDDAKFIDNYISAVGTLKADAANIILQKMDWDSNNLIDLFNNLADFHSYPISWYDQTVGFSGSPMGNAFSFEAGDLDPPPDVPSYFVQSDPYGNEIALTEIGASEANSLMLLRDGRILNELVSDVLSLGSINGPVQAVGNITAEVYEKLQDWTLRLILEEASPAYAWVPIMVPDDMTMLSFEFLFDAVGDDDFLSFGIGEELLFAIEGKYINDGELLSSGLLDISDWAGQDVELFFGLNSDGIAGGTMTIEGIEFYAIPEPATLGLLLLAGLAGLLRRR